jgi:hypothetical protein
MAAWGDNTKLQEGVRRPIYGTNGLCQARTMHSEAGLVCGGYGAIVRSVPLRLQKNSTLVVTVTRIDECSCQVGADNWVMPYRDSGICQRSCLLPGFIDQPIKWFAADGTYVEKNVTRINSRCGGLTQGQCRPLGADGFNSACVCDIGWMGPDCQQRDTRIYDGGAAGTQGNSDAMCGRYGQKANLPMPPNSTSPHLLYELFNSRVGSLQGSDIVNQATAYAMFTCECGLDAPQGYAVDPSSHRGKLTCSRTCASLNGCNGRGSCVPGGNPAGSVDAVCQCQRGWGGDDCSQRVLVDAQGQECGGADRGVIVYTDDSFQLKQECVCR